VPDDGCLSSFFLTKYLEKEDVGILPASNSQLPAYYYSFI
jgi:hypothetical protein